MGEGDPLYSTYVSTDTIHHQLTSLIRKSVSLAAYDATYLRVAAILNLDVSFNSEKQRCCSSILCSPSLNKIQRLFYRTYNLFNRSKSLKFRKEF